MLSTVFWLAGIGQCQIVGMVRQHGAYALLNCARPPLAALPPPARHHRRPEMDQLKTCSARLAAQ